MFELEVQLNKLWIEALLELHPRDALDYRLPGMRGRDAETDIGTSDDYGDTERRIQ
jgi:hypothetical protein